MKTKNSTKKKLAAFALPALLLSFGFYGMILWTGCGVNSGSVLVLCGVVYGLAWSTGIITTGTSPFWVFVKQFSRNDTATACQDWLTSQSSGLTTQKRRRS